MSGWSGQASTLIVLQVTIPGYSGLFIYGGAPGPGTLIMSIAAAAGTDPYGNAYPAGIGLFGSTDQLVWPASGTGLTLYQTALLAGMASYLVLGGNNGTNGQSSLWIRQDGVILAQNPAAGGGPEVVHTLAAGSGWAGTLSYWKTPDNKVALSATLTAPGGAVNNVPIFTLGPPYRPAGTHTVPAPASALNGAATGDGRVTLDATGVIQSNGIAAGATVSIEAEVPLFI